MVKMLALCLCALGVAGDRDVQVPSGRSLLQSGAAMSVKVGIHDHDASAETDSDRKSITSSLDLYVKIMENEVTNMREKMKVVEGALGVSADGVSATGGTGEKAAETAPTTAPESLQQIASDPAATEGSGNAAAESSSSDGADPLKARILQLEAHVADLLSRSSAVESELGVPNAYLLQMHDDPLMGMANRAIALHVKVHDLHGRTSNMEHIVLQSLKPDATLLTKEVETLEVNVNTLKTIFQGPSSLLSIKSTDGGLKSQISDLETRVAELLSTTTMLETELHGTVQTDTVATTALLQKADQKHGLVPRMSSLKSEVASLKPRVFTLEHHITG